MRTIAERMKDKMKAKMEAYDNEVNGRLHDDGFECRHKYKNEFYIDDNDEEVADPEEPNEAAEADEFTPEGYDEYIGAQRMVPFPDGRMQGKIVKRAKDNNGNPIGRRHDNYLLNARRYKVELANGTVDEYYASGIAENLFSQKLTQRETNIC
jgi:hypothetical protein